MPTRRSAFFISDRTGITAEMLGHSLLTQFEQVEFSETTLPFIDTPEKAQAAVDEINAAGMRDGCVRWCSAPWSTPTSAWWWSRAMRWCWTASRSS
jgi:regulator of PEP synthase PpsR (kinase-PPPase family)